MSGETGDITQLQQEYNELFGHIKTLHESVTEDRKTFKEHFEPWLEKLDGVDVEAVKSASQRLAEVEEKLQIAATRANRPASTTGSTPGENKQVDIAWKRYLKSVGRDDSTDNREAARKAFTTFLRHGKEMLEPEQRKLLSTDDSQNGGYLVVPEFANEIIKDLANISQIRPIARVRQTGTMLFSIPKRTARVSGGWVGEGQASSESDSNYGRENIPNGKLAVHSRATSEELADSMFDVEGQIRMDIVEEFDKLEGQAFLNGNGVNKPKGLFEHSGIVSVNSGDANNITYTGLVRVSHGDSTNGDFNPQYLRNARWLMRAATLGSVRLLEDSAGNIIYQPALPGQGITGTIFGYPITLAADAPAEAANNNPVMFGDFRQAYTIMDRIGFEMLRNPYSEDTQGIVRFTAYRRVGGQVVLDVAVRKLTVST